VPDLTVIVAARNEEANIEACVRRIAAAADGDWETIVVAGGTDDTATIVERLAGELPGLRCVRQPGDRGKGHAIRSGVAAATAAIHAQVDADLQFLPEELPRLVAPIREGRADVVLGSRFVPGAVRRPGSTPPLRTAGNHAVSGWASWLAGHRMTDVMAGFKAWTREAIDRIALVSDGFSYEAEIALKGVRRGLRVEDVPVTTEARHGGATNVSLLADGLALFADLTAFRLGWK